MEFEPLYPAGFHDITTNNLEEIFVNPFTENDKRKYLMNRFRIFLEKYLELGLSAEIWIDGSYSTQKQNPGDIDILIVYNNNEVIQLPIEKKTKLEELLNRDISKIRYSIDVLSMPSNNEVLRSYWRGWFGFSRSEQPKGIPRIFYGFN